MARGPRAHHHHAPQRAAHSPSAAWVRGFACHIGQLASTPAGLEVRSLPSPLRVAHHAHPTTLHARVLALCRPVCAWQHVARSSLGSSRPGPVHGRACSGRCGCCQPLLHVEQQAAARHGGSIPLRPGAVHKHPQGAVHGHRQARAGRRDGGAAVSNAQPTQFSWWSRPPAVGQQQILLGTRAQQQPGSPRSPCTAAAKVAREAAHEAMRAASPPSAHHACLGALAGSRSSST